MKKTPRLHPTGNRQLRLEQLEPRLVLDASALVISEFMASNDNTLLDAEGDASDWVEILNSGAEAVDLTGLHLTDDAEQLDRWEFQAGTTIGPGGFLLVFASGKDTVFNGPNAGGTEQHTDFKLSAGGEYLAIVDVDGSTIIDEFAPEFLPQQEDLSYGSKMASTGVQTVRLATGANAMALVPINDNLGLSWTDPDFNDASWPLSGPTGFGYENNPGNSTNFVDEIQTSIPSGTRSYFLRVPFTLTELDDIGSLTLRMKYDDGFVAYLNGHRFAEAYAPDTLHYNSTATNNHDDFLAEQFAEFDASAAIPYLRVGENVLAIHALNLANSSDALHVPELVSSGSQLVDPTTQGFFVEPTPGYGNVGTPIAGFTAAPEFSLPHGFYESTQIVALDSTTPNSKIVYTTDGSTPTVDGSLNVLNGTLYVNALSISTTTTLRARAFRAEYEPSPLVASTYLFINDIIQQSPSGQLPGSGWAPDGRNGQSINYGIDPDIINLYGAEAVKESLRSLSTFSITTDIDNLFDRNTGIYVNAGYRGRDWERPASVELIDDAEGFQINAGLRIRGGYSRNDFNPKHAFRFYFRGEYGATKLEYPVFGDEGVDKFDVLDLRTAQNYSWSSSGDYQNTFVREVFGRDFQRDADQPYTRSRYHHLYLNGEYWGIFQTQERIEKYYAESYFGGEEEDYDVVKSDLAVTGGTEVADGDDLAWRALFNSAQALANNPSGNSNNYWTMQGLNPDGTRNPSLPVLLDVDNLADYMLALFYTGGYDTGLSQFLNNNQANNWFGVRNRVTGDQGFQFFIHDNEHALGANNTNTIDRTGPFNNGNQNNFSQFNPQYLHQDLLASPEYRLAFADRVHKHLFNDGALTTDASVAKILQRAAEVEPAIIAESARWGDSKRGTPFNKTDWQNEINTLGSGYFNLRRNLLLNSQLPGDGLYPSTQAPTFNQFGGLATSSFTLNMSAPTGTIYYTVDGTDPRAIGGSVGANAQAFSTPFGFSSAQTVKARVLLGGNWSALTEATFTVPQPADFNESGSVDGTDLAWWSANWGTSSNSPADSDGDGDTDGNDFLNWQRNFTGPGESQVASVSLATSTLETIYSHLGEPVSESAEVEVQEGSFFVSLSNGLPTTSIARQRDLDSQAHESPEASARQLAFAQVFPSAPAALAADLVAASRSENPLPSRDAIPWQFDELIEGLPGDAEEA